MTAMDDETTWPLGQILPLRRDAGELWPEPGLLVAGVGPVVHLLPLSEATPKNLRLCRVERFASFAALRQAGWGID